MLLAHRDVLHIHPEADPGHNHDEDGGDVALDQWEESIRSRDQY